MHKYSLHFDSINPCLILLSALNIHEKNLSYNPIWVEDFIYACLNLSNSKCDASRSCSITYWLFPMVINKLCYLLWATENVFWLRWNHVWNKWIHRVNKQWMNFKLLIEVPPLSTNTHHFHRFVFCSLRKHPKQERFFFIP